MLLLAPVFQWEPRNKQAPAVDVSVGERQIFISSSPLQNPASCSLHYFVFQTILPAIGLWQWEVGGGVGGIRAVLGLRVQTPVVSSPFATGRWWWGDGEEGGGGGG